jgi:hypothetical protein
MSYRSQSLHQLIEDRNRSLLLPHIQRPFVWKEEQMVRLLDSLMRGYPIQTFLLWKTREFIKARKFMDEIRQNVALSDLYDEMKSEEGVEKTFVLDGQQRLQTLFTIFSGAIADGARREAWIDLHSGTEPDPENLYYRIKFAAESPGPSWFRIPSLRTQHARNNAEEIAEEINEKLDDPSWTAAESREKQRLVRRNISQLVSLLRNGDHFWYEELDGIAHAVFSYDRVLDIFVRVNSGGTKLDGSDLMFAAMKGMSETVEEEVEEVAETLNRGDLKFTKDWVLKCLVVAHDGGAEVSPKLFRGAAGEALMKQIEDSWPRSLAAFQQLRDFLHQSIRAHSEKIIRSYGSLIPLFDFLYHHPQPTPQTRQQMVSYFYRAQLFNWYGSSTDKIIAALHNLMRERSDFPLADILRYFHGLGRETTLNIDNLTSTRSRTIILNLVYQESFGSSAFDAMFPGNQPHIDHIFPKSSLHTRLHLGTEDVNHLGNYRFVGATDNIRKRAQLPASYFSDLQAANVPVHKHLMVEPWASDPAQLTFDRDTYMRFRDARLRAIFEMARKIVNLE